MRHRGPFAALTRVFPIACALAGFAVLAACTSSASSTPLPSPSITTHSAAIASSGAVGKESQQGESCHLTTKKQVAASFRGVVSGEQVDATGIGVPRCTFALSRSNTGAPGSVVVTRTTAAAATQYKAMRAAQPHPHSVAVGDRAFYVPGVLCFVRKGTLVVISAQLRVPGGHAPKAGVLEADVLRLGKIISGEL